MTFTLNSQFSFVHLRSENYNIISCILLPGRTKKYMAPDKKEIMGIQVLHFLKKKQQHTLYVLIRIVSVRQF